METTINGIVEIDLQILWFDHNIILKSYIGKNIRKEK